MLYLERKMLYLYNYDVEKSELSCKKYEVKETSKLYMTIDGKRFYPLYTYRINKENVGTTIFVDANNPVFINSYTVVLTENNTSQASKMIREYIKTHVINSLENRLHEIQEKIHVCKKDIEALA